MILKKFAGIAFAIAFLMAIVLFTNIGRQYISLSIAKIIFMISGAIGLLLNLLSFQSGKNTLLFNFLYWTGSIVLFVGLTFILMRYPYGFYIIITGLVIVGASFILPESLLYKKDSNNDLLDEKVN